MKLDKVRRIMHEFVRYLANVHQPVLVNSDVHKGSEGRNICDYPRQPHSRLQVFYLLHAFGKAEGFELLAWVATLKPAPRTIFLVHGDLEPATTLAELLRTRTGAAVHVPETGQEFELWT